MTVQHYQLQVDFVSSDVMTWYDKTTDGDTAVIALPRPPAVWLFHRPRGHVYWWTAGERGMTVSLGHARQRLAMVQERVGERADRRERAIAPNTSHLITLCGDHAYAVPRSVRRAPHVPH
jgi:hypothetical protein